MKREQLSKVICNIDERQIAEVSDSVTLPSPLWGILYT